MKNFLRNIFKPKAPPHYNIRRALLKRFLYKMGVKSAESFGGFTPRRMTK